MHKIAFYLLWLLVFTIPWQNVVVFPMLGTISRLIGFLVVGIAIIYILIKRQVSEPSLLLILMALFVAWSFMTYFWSISPGGTLVRFVTNVQLLAMAWLIWELCKTHLERDKLIQAFILGAYVSISDMIITYQQATADSFRIVATGFNPNELAATLALGIPFAFYLLVERKNNIFYWFNLLYIPLAIFAIVLTASRGGTMIAMVAILVIPITFLWLEQRSKYIIFSFVIISIMFISIWLPSNLEKIEANIERISETPTALREGDLNYRQIIWRAGWQVFSENSLVGVGAAGFRQSVAEPLYYERGKAPHNAYLSVLVETGILGFLLFISILFVVILPILGLKSPRREILFILYIATLVALMPLGWEYNKSLWFILSMLSLYKSYVIRNFKLVQVNRNGYIK